MIALGSFSVNAVRSYQSVSGFLVRCPPVTCYLSFVAKRPEGGDIDEPPYATPGTKSGGRAGISNANSTYCNAALAKCRPPAKQRTRRICSARDRCGHRQSATPAEEQTQLIAGLRETDLFASPLLPCPTMHRALAHIELHRWLLPSTKSSTCKIEATVRKV